MATPLPPAERPTMGWSSWNTYRVDISDSLIMQQADAMEALVLKKAGYKYVNIDDGYFGGRDQQTGQLLFTLHVFHMD
jgi:alpha-galactosidase